MMFTPEINPSLTHSWIRHVHTCATQNQAKSIAMLPVAIPSIEAYSIMVTRDKTDMSSQARGRCPSTPGHLDVP